MVYLTLVSNEFNHSFDWSSHGKEGVTGSDVYACLRGIIDLVKLIIGTTVLKTKLFTRVTSLLQREVVLMRGKKSVCLG